MLLNDKKTAYWDQKIDEKHKRDYNSIFMKIRINTKLNFRYFDRSIDINIVVKFDNIRNTFQRTTLQKFFLKQWIKQMKSLLKIEHKRFLNYDFQINVKILTRFKLSFSQFQFQFQFRNVFFFFQNVINTSIANVLNITKIVFRNDEFVSLNKKNWSHIIEISTKKSTISLNSWLTNDYASTIRAAIKIRVVLSIIKIFIIKSTKHNVKFERLTLLQIDSKFQYLCFLSSYTII